MNTLQRKYIKNGRTINISMDLNNEPQKVTNLLIITNREVCNGIKIQARGKV